MKISENINDILQEGLGKFEIGKNFLNFMPENKAANQQQTEEAFSNKWSDYNSKSDTEAYYELQRKWYLELYGFKSEEAFSDFLKEKKFIYDAGCGLGFKSAWFASLAPHAIVIGMDISGAVEIAAEKYRNIPNLYFIRGDISYPYFINRSIDYVSCDQVIMHTEDPDKTFSELTRITAREGEFACYFYAKKALPRELLDDFFRAQCKNMSDQELKEMSGQLTELGKRLSSLKISIDVPSIPALDIKGGEMDLQRFIYWNFLKCYWNEDLGWDTSVMVNYDWYSPSNARRYSKAEIAKLLENNNMDIISLHEEEACFSGRFKHQEK